MWNLYIYLLVWGYWPVESGFGGKTQKQIVAISLQLLIILCLASNPVMSEATPLFNN